MSKYEPLQKYLEELKKDDWKASFSDIEKILGFSLPKSAHNYPAWWSNNRQGSRHAKAWLDAGWITENVNFFNNTIIFRRNYASVKHCPKRLQKKLPPHNVPPELYPWDERQVQKCSLDMEWNPLGKILMDDLGRLIFPKAENLPAIYRIRVRQGKSEALYLGETDNLSRRFGNYRKPGPTQQTNLRINTILIEALSKGAEVSVSAVTFGAWICWGGGREAADLSSKAVRCLLENAAIMNCGGAEIELLNRVR